MTPPDTPSNLRSLLSVKEVANTLAISQSGVYRLIEAGSLRRLRVGARTLFERSEVERYIATQRAASVSKDDAAPSPGRPAVVLLSGGLDSSTTLV